MEKSKKKKNFSRKFQVIIPMVIGIALGAAVGLLAGKASSAIIGKSDEEVTFAEMMTSVLTVVVFFYLAFFLQVIIHEGGHLVMGLLTGYRFISFRIGSFMFLKKDGKLSLKRMSLAGTGGQCLMAPPSIEGEKMPYVLYNLGGSLFNLLAAVLFLIPVVLGNGNGMLRVFCEVAAVLGLGSALMNGIPMRMSGIANDGYNAMTLGKSPAGLLALRRQLEMNAQLALGKRPREMPKEWFAMPSEEEMGNMMTATQAVMHCGLLMDELCFSEAEELMEKLVSGENAIAGLHRNTMKCDLITCELLGEGRQEKLSEWKDKALDKFMKSMKKYPSIIRTQYAWALLYEKDEKKAEGFKNYFEKVAKTYPYDGDLASERELMECCRDCYEGRKDKNV